MTRAEKALEESKRFERSLTESDLASLSRSDMGFAFQSGIRWADDHPKSPWISVEEDLPCNHEELIDTTRHYQVSKNVIVRHKDGSVTFERMTKNYKNQWIFPSDVTHWTQIPELPK